MFTLLDNILWGGGVQAYYFHYRKGFWQKNILEQILENKKTQNPKKVTDKKSPHFVINLSGQTRLLDMYANFCHKKCFIPINSKEKKTEIMHFITTDVSDVINKNIMWI